MQTTKELIALFDAVIVKPFEEKEGEYGGIIVPDMGKEKNEKGTVIAVGPGKHTVTGDFISTTIKIGEVVILPTMGFSKLPFEGTEYYVGPENQILGAIREKKSTLDDVLKDTEENITITEKIAIEESIPVVINSK